jgi:hypothetical protein
MSEYTRTYAQGASGTHNSPFVRRDSIALRIQELRDEIASREAALAECLALQTRIEAECDACPTLREAEVAARITGAVQQWAPGDTLRPGEVDVDISHDLVEVS